MAIHCITLQIDAQEQVRKKNQITHFCFLDAISFVGLLRDFKISLSSCPQMSRPTVLCAPCSMESISGNEKCQVVTDFILIPPSYGQKASQTAYKKVVGKPHLSCTCDGPFKVNRQN